MPEIETGLALNIFICLLGLVWHFLMKWSEYRKSTELDVSLKQFIRLHPAQSAATVVATAIAFLLAHAFGLMNAGTALAAGYMGSSMADNWASRYAKQ